MNSAATNIDRETAQAKATVLDLAAKLAKLNMISRQTTADLALVGSREFGGR